MKLFFMWVQESNAKVSIWRFMVDHNHQQQSIGRTALGLALTEIGMDEDNEDMLAIITL
jgi:diamine N-acetyltransferase